MYSSDKIRELDIALEWTSSNGVTANGSKSSSFSPFSSSPTSLSSSYSPLTSTTTSRSSSSSFLPRHFVDAVRVGRHLPAIVRLTPTVAARSSSSSTTRVALSDGYGDYVAFCRQTSDRSSATDGTSDPQIKETRNDDSTLVWMTSLMSHRRAVFKAAANNRYLTLPVDSVYQFHPINHAGRSTSAVFRSEALSLKDAIDLCTNTGSHRQLSFVIAVDDLDEKSSGGSLLGRLSFVGHYDTVDLVGRQIVADQTGELALGDVICVPMYAPVTLEVATGLQRQPLIEFRNLKESLAKLNDALTSSSTEPQDVKMPSVITSSTRGATSELVLSDLQYVEPELRLPVFPSTSMAPQHSRDVQPPPRRKNATYGKLTEVGGNPSTVGDHRSSSLSASLSSSSLTTSGPRSLDSVSSTFVAGSIRTSKPKIVLPDWNSGAIESELVDGEYRSKTPSPFASLSSSPAQSRQKAHSQPAALHAGSALKPPSSLSSLPSSSSNSNVSLRRNASSDSRPTTGGSIYRERSSLSLSVDRQSDDSDSVRRSPMTESRKVSQRDRVSVLAASAHWQKRDVKSLPNSPEIGRLNGSPSVARPCRMTRSRMESPNGSDELLNKSSLPKVTIRPAGTDQRPAPAKLRLSKVWMSASGSDPESPRTTVASTGDADVKETTSSSASGVDDSETTSADRRGSSQANADARNVKDAAQTSATEELSAEQLQSLTVNPYLCLIADDYADSAPITNSSPSTNGRVGVGLQKRRLSSSLSDVKGTHLFKERPLSASMININRPLPEIPSTNDAADGRSSGRRSDGNRGSFPSSIGSLSTKPLRKLFSLVTKRKSRQSGSEKSGGTSPTVDDADDENDDEQEPETADQLPTAASRFVGERHVYEPLRQPAVGDASRGDDVSVGCRWRTASEIPKDIQHFTVRDIADCLCLLKMERYAEQFAEQDVDGSLLVSMDEDLLQDSFGMTGLEAKKIFQFAKKGWRPRT